MNIERFHNELALRLGYEHIVKDKRIQIFVEESVDPLVTLKVEGGEDIRFRATDNPVEMKDQITPEIKEIIEAVHHAYLRASNNIFSKIII